MPTTRVRARWVIASDGATHHILEDGEVVYDGNRIVFTGHGFAGAVDEEIDAGNAVVGPGFVDLDALFDLDSTMLVYENQPSAPKGRVWPADYVTSGPRDVYSDAEEDFQHAYAMAQLLLNGITTALPIRSILYRAWGETYAENARAAGAAARLGIRMYLGPSYRTGLPMLRADGSITMHWDEQRGLAGLDDAIRFVEDFDGAHGGLIRGFLQPDRIEGCTDELLARTRDAAERLGVPVRLHCCQGELELRVVEERWGKTSLTVLHDLGFLHERALLPHGIYLGGLQPAPEQVERELGWLAESNATIVHCPIVSARLGNVMDSFPRFRAGGIRIGLGTDTAPPDLIWNMHAGLMVTRISDGANRVSAADYYTAATIDGADAIGRPDLGRLTPGALADITIFDLDGIHLGPSVDPIESIVYSGSGRDITTVIVDGRVVVRDRQLTAPGVDLAAMHRQAQAQYERLIASYPERALGHPPVEEIFTPSFPVRRAAAGEGAIGD